MSDTAGEVEMEGNGAETIQAEDTGGDVVAEKETPPSARDLLLDIELDATLQFGSRDLSLQDVLALGPGDVVELDRHISEPVDLLVGDKIVARGEVVVVSGNFGLLITEVAEPQLRLESIRWSS